MSYCLKLTGLSVVLCLLLAGCSSPERDMLVGKWEIEKPDKILKRIENDEGNSADKDRAASQRSSQMLIFFRPNGKLETTTSMWDLDYGKKGTWKLLSFDREKQESRIQCVLNGQTTEHQVEWQKNGNLKMVPPNMAGTTTKLEFRRVD